MASVRAISGVGTKGPACFLLEAEGARLLFDLGYGPQPGLWPDVSRVGRVDAIVLSHGHQDHAGGLALASQLGRPPVYATPAVIAMLDTELETQELSVGGATSVCGITVRIGRNGHSPGGVWLHADVGGGVLYTGDYSVESLVYLHDEPPAAETVILDASYGLYDAPLAACMASLEAALEAPAALLPVPVLGRGPDIAYHLARRGKPLRLGADLRAALRHITAAPEMHGLLAEPARVLKRVCEEAPAIDGNHTGVIITGSADASAGDAARVLADWDADKRYPIVFTGYLNPRSPAERLTETGRALYRRWNVHPRLSDNVALVRAAGARVVVPAFGEARHREGWSAAFAPARVVIHEAIDLS